MLQLRGDSALEQVSAPEQVRDDGAGQRVRTQPEPLDNELTLPLMRRRGQASGDGARAFQRLVAEHLQDTVLSSGVTVCTSRGSSSPFRSALR